jgi:hypothetical protein
MIVFAAVWLLAVIAGVVLAPDAERQRLYLLAFYLAITAWVLWSLRRAARDADCPACGASIFEEIQSLAGKQQRLSFCPCCGVRLNVAE